MEAMVTGSSSDYEEFIIAADHDESSLISKLLDNLGLSTERVAVRIQMSIVRANITNIMMTTVKKDGDIVLYETTRLATGSQAEGLGLLINEIEHTPATRSDVDYLDVINKTRVDSILYPVAVHDGEERVEQDDLTKIVHYFATTSDYNPGFVDLHFTHPKTLHRQIQSSGCAHTVGNVEPPLPLKMNQQIHGPATQYQTDVLEMDTVKCFHLPTWPTIANEWLLRLRHYGWPSSSLVCAVQKRGCHIVPIGNPNSPNHSSEWRLSFSVAERTLVWSFTDIQRKCYFILKIICKEVIEEAVPGVISSYHMKTLLFWEIEETDRRQWCLENLLSLVCRCLYRLQSWISDENVPNYFVPENNMVRHKLTSDIPKNKIVEILKKVGANVWEHLHRCDTVAKNLYTVSEQNPSNQRMFIRKEGLVSAIIINCLPTDLWDGIQIAILMSAEDTSLETILATQLTVLQILKRAYPRVLIKYAEAMIESNIGSLYHSLYRQSCQSGRPDADLAKQAEAYLLLGIDKLPAFGHLRLANFYYLEKRFPDASLMLAEYGKWLRDVYIRPDPRALYIYEKYKLMTVGQKACDILECYSNIELPQSRGWSYLIEETYRRDWTPVVFTVSDIPCVEKPVVYEITATFFDPGRCAYIHPNIFASYLSFGVAFHSSQSQKSMDLARTCLEKWADRINKTEAESGHACMENFDTTSGHNMLAYCLVVMGDYQAAARHVIQSLLIRTDWTNAAWHYLATTLAKLMGVWDACQTQGLASKDFQGIYMLAIGSQAPSQIVLLDMLRRLVDPEIYNYSRLAYVLMKQIQNGYINEM